MDSVLSPIQNEDAASAGALHPPQQGVKLVAKQRPWEGQVGCTPIHHSLPPAPIKSAKRFRHYCNHRPVLRRSDKLSSSGDRRRACGHRICEAAFFLDSNLVKAPTDGANHVVNADKAKRSKTSEATFVVVEMHLSVATAIIQSAPRSRAIGPG